MVAVGVLLAGCTGSGASSEDYAPAIGQTEPGFAEPYVEPGAPQPDATTGDGEQGSGGSGDTGTSAGSDPTAEADPAREVISEGYVIVSVDDPIEAADDAASLVEAVGGRIDARTEQPAVDDDGAADGASRDGALGDGALGDTAVGTSSGSSGGTYPGPVPGTEASARLVARIPASALTETLGGIKELGEYQEGSLSATDVTFEARDLDARITALSTSVDRLVGLLATAETTEDLLTVETTLSQRQADLESLQSQRRSIAERVDLATVTITLTSEASVPPDAPDTFLTGLVTGWTALVAFLGGALVATGVALPWIVVVAVLALVAAAVVRRVSRRRASRLASDGESPTQDSGHRIEE